jgi:hypothetical protein
MTFKDLEYDKSKNTQNQHLRQCPKCKAPNYPNKWFCYNCGYGFTFSKKVFNLGIVFLVIVGGMFFASILFLINDFNKFQQAQQTQQRTNPSTTSTSSYIDPDEKIIGPQPNQSPDGVVLEVQHWFRDNLNDYSSSEYISWTPIKKVEIADGTYKGKYWAVAVKIRAKNAFGAYIVKRYAFLIRFNAVIRAIDLDEAMIDLDLN